MTFYQLAEKLDKEFQQKEAKLAEAQSKQDEKASLLATKEASLEEERVRLGTWERKVQQDNEESSRKMLIVMKSDEALRMRDDATAKMDSAQKILKQADEKLGEAKQKLEEVGKRELALSEAKKNYKEEIRKEVADKMLGIRI